MCQSTLIYSLRRHVDDCVKLPLFIVQTDITAPR